MSEKMVVIINPAAGSAGEDFRAQVEKALRDQGAEFEVRETTPDVSGGQLAEAAVQDGATHLVACGGDGTVMSVVNGLGKHAPGKQGSKKNEAAAVKSVAECAENGTVASGLPQITLSIIPGGTANLLAAALDIPTDTDEAAAIVVTGEDRTIDLGQCGDTLFALGLGLGLTEKLVSQTSTQQKARWGKLAYAFAMLRELGARPHEFYFKLDGGRLRRTRGVALVVANAGEIGGRLRFAPRAKMDDGKLDLCILHRFYFRDFLRMAARGLFGKLQQDRAVSFYQARRIEIRSNPPLDLQIDGEEVDKSLPLVVEVKPAALRVRGRREGQKGEREKGRGNHNDATKSNLV